MTDADNFPVVGIGASAGGIQAMEGFFKGVPDDSGMAFVVVTHLSPDRESLLHEIIARYTGMAVRIVSHDLPIEPNTVYVLPPNAVLTVEQGALHPRELDPVHRERKPVDIFFASLAAEFGERAIGVVLSGGDGDGTLGVKAIKERGGLTLAQIQDTYGPTNPGMPQSAITSGLIDTKAKAEEMGGKLVEYAAGFDILAELSQDGDEPEMGGRARQNRHRCGTSRPFGPRFLGLQGQDIHAPGTPAHAGSAVALTGRLSGATQA